MTWSKSVNTYCKIEKMREHVNSLYTSLDSEDRCSGEGGCAKPVNQRKGGVAIGNCLIFSSRQKHGPTQKGVPTACQCNHCAGPGGSLLPRVYRRVVVYRFTRIWRGRGSFEIGTLAPGVGGQLQQCASVLLTLKADGRGRVMWGGRHSPCISIISSRICECKNISTTSHARGRRIHKLLPPDPSRWPPRTKNARPGPTSGTPWPASTHIKH